MGCPQLWCNPITVLGNCAFRPDPPRFGSFYPKRHRSEKGTGVPVTFSITSGRSGVQRTP